jgi:hypothetical protein
MPWLVGAWLCGVAFFSLRFAGGILLLEQKRRGPLGEPSPRILAACCELQHRLGLTRAIRYLECGWVRAPAVIGWLRPVILLPVWAATGLSEAQFRAVIAHELAHIRRHDFLVNLLQIFVETVLFYHPAIWWLNARIRAERELCCDEIAVRLTGDRLEYARVLTLMAECEQAPVLAMAANRGPLSQRIFHILGKKPFGAGQRMAGVTAGILFLIAAFGAANALIGIAYPVPMAHAKARLQTVLSSSRIAANHLARQVLQADGPAPKSIPSSLPGLDGATAGKMAASERTDATAENQAEALPLPDLSRLLPTETLITPAQSSDPGAELAANTARSTTTPKAQACVLPAITHSANLQEVSGSDLRTVAVEINGTPKQFLLDIGTNPTQVSQSTVEDLALPDVSRTAASPFLNYLQPVALYDVKSGASAEDFRPHVRVASFSLGDATGHDLAFLVAKDPELGRSKPYDGLLTGNFLGPNDVELDFVQNKINYLTPTTCTDPDQVAYWRHAAAAVIPMTNWNGKIQIMVSIQGQAIPAVIDTASPRTVMRRDIAEMMLGLKADTADMAPDGDRKDGTGLQIYRHTFAQIAFPGGVTAYSVPALIQSNSMIHSLDKTPVLGSRAQFTADPRQRIPGLTLGMDVLHQLHLIVVQGQQRLYVTSAG